MDPRKFLVSGRKFLFGCKFCFVRKDLWFNGFSARFFRECFVGSELSIHALEEVLVVHTG